MKFWLRQRLVLLGRWLILFDYVSPCDEDDAQRALIHDLRRQCKALRDERDRIKLQLVINAAKRRKD